MITAGVCLTLQQAVCLRRETLAYDGLGELKKLIVAAADRFVPGDLEDFRRACDMVRLAQLGAILAASDRCTWSPAGTALIGWNGCGCTPANQAYWDDYQQHGRETGRGMFFVPTLPSIPVCEAAITLHLQGPVCYIRTPPQTRKLQEHLDDLFSDDATIRQIMLAEIHVDHACLLLCDRQPGPLPDHNDLTAVFWQAKKDLTP